MPAREEMEDSVSEENITMRAAFLYQAIRVLDSQMKIPEIGLLLCGSV